MNMFCAHKACQNKRALKAVDQNTADSEKAIGLASVGDNFNGS